MCLRGMGLRCALENGKFSQDEVERRADGRQRRQFSSRKWSLTIRTTEAVAGSSGAKKSGHPVFCFCAELASTHYALCFQSLRTNKKF